MGHNGDASFESDFGSHVFPKRISRVLYAGLEQEGDGNIQGGRCFHLESKWTITRRPNKRESSENAPGPKKKRAAVTQNVKAM